MNTSSDATIDIDGVVDIGTAQLVTCSARVGAALITTFTCACNRQHDCVVVIPHGGPDDFGPVETVQRIEERMGHDSPDDDRTWAIEAAEVAVLRYLAPAPKASTSADPVETALKHRRVRAEDLPILAFIRSVHPCRSAMIRDAFPCEFRAHEGRLQRLRTAGLIVHRLGRWSPANAVPGVSPASPA